MEENDIKVRMQRVIESVKEDLAAIRTGRAASSMVANIEVAVYGGAQKLKVQEIGNISVPDAQTIVVDPWDKSIIGEVRKGILEANASFNPAIDGEILRIVIPPATGEDREKNVKLLGAKIEQGKILIRHVRAEAKKSYEEGDLSEDEKFAKEKKLQEITDEFNEKLVEMEETKKQEILTLGS